ncbi:MAG TPA: hypothetical protein VFH61_05345 [Thermoleophilia bacterium]|nr:hypothetical protein [Thermoleophilia bacterium]
MTWTYDLTTDIGKTRLRVSDTDTTRRIMDDEDYQAFLDMAGGSVVLAAAMALEAIAVNEVLCLKVVNLMGAIVTDAASAAKQLLAQAKTLRAEYAQLGDGGPGFISIEMVDGVEMRREKMAKVLESEGY